MNGCLLKFSFNAFSYLHNYNVKVIIRSPQVHICSCTCCIPVHLQNVSTPSHRWNLKKVLYISLQLPVIVRIRWRNMLPCNRQAAELVCIQDPHCLIRKTKRTSRRLYFLRRRRTTVMRVCLATTTKKEYVLSRALRDFRKIISHIYIYIYITYSGEINLWKRVYVSLA